MLIRRTFLLAGAQGVPVTDDKKSDIDRGGLYASVLSCLSNYHQLCKAEVTGLCPEAVLDNVLAKLRQKSKELDQDRCGANALSMSCLTLCCFAISSSTS